MTDRKLRASFLFEKAGFPFAAGYDLQFKDVFTGDSAVYRELRIETLEPYACKIFRATPVKRV